MTRFLPVLLAIPSLCRAAAATVDLAGNTLDFTRIPLSVASETAGGAYGSYDVLRVFTNPAFLAYQPRTWEVSLSSQLRYGDMGLHSIAAGWAGQPTDTGIFGVALLGSMYSLPGFDERDVLRNRTGVSVQPAGYHFGIAGMYYWKYAAFGVGYRQAIEDYGMEELASKKAGMIDGGVAFNLGNMDVGAAYRGIGDVSVLTAGAGIKLKGRLKGSIGGEWNVPLVQSVASYGGGGLSFDVRKDMTVRMGVKYNGADMLACLGMAAPLKYFSLDFGMTMPLGSGLGPNLMAGLRWYAGRDRAAVQGPKFFLEERERTLAVMDFEARNTAAGDAGVITDILRSALVKEGVFNIVEKSSMDRILGEQAFQQTGCTTSECAVKLGKILNVRYLVVGTFGKTMGSSIVSMRVVAVETAKIIYTDEIEGETLTAIRAGIGEMAKRMTDAVKKD